MPLPLPSNSDLSKARRQRDDALKMAREAKRTIQKALKDLEPARKEVNNGFKSWKQLHPKLTREKLVGKDKGKPVRRVILALLLPEISRAYMESWKRAPRAIKVINNVTDEIKAIDKDLGSTIAQIEAIKIPSPTSDLAALASISGQVQAARDQALIVVDRAIAAMGKCATYKKNAMPFLRATDKLLSKVNNLASANLKKLEDRKLVLLFKEKRIEGYRDLTKNMGKFQKKINLAIRHVSQFVGGCPNSRRQLISVRGEISTIKLPGMSTAPTASPILRGSQSLIGRAMSPREMVIAMLYAQTPHLHATHYLG